MKKRILSLLLAAVLLLGLTTVALAENEQAPEGLSLRLYENGTFTGPYLTKLTHGNHTTKTYGVFLDGERQTGYTAESSEVHTAEVDEDGFLTLTLGKMNDPWYLGFQIGEEQYNIQFKYENYQTYSFEYQEQEYTLVFGPLRDQQTIEIYAGWFGMDADSSGQYVAAAIYENFGDSDNQQPASAEVQNLITNVALSVTDDDNGCMSVQQAEQQAGGWWKGKAVVSGNNKAGDGYITAEITINNEKTITLKAVGRVFAVEKLDKAHEASGKPTANMASLQEMLDGMDLQGKDATLTLTPGAIYEGTLIVERSGLNGLTIKGGVDSKGNPTVIRGGIELKTSITAIEDLCFAAPSSEGYTVAVDHKAKDAQAWWISKCAFIGYAIAVNCNGNGYSLPTHNNLFVNNQTAVRFTCGTTNMQKPNSIMSNSVFLNNGVAVEIVSLPDTVVRYEFRIRDCDFIDNEKDFVTPENQAGPYYFHENYFGDTVGNNSGKVKARGAKLTGSVAHEICQINPVSFRWGPNTCWWQGVKLNNGFLFHSTRSAMASEEETQSNVLVETLNDLNYRLEIIQGGGLTILDEAKSTEVLNSDTTKLTLGADALQDVSIQVNEPVNGTDVVLGTWTFE